MTKSSMTRASLGVVMLVAAVGSTSAVESLGPNEVVAAVTWTTGGEAVIDDANETGLKNALWPNTIDNIPHTLQANMLSLLILDTVTLGIRNLAVDAVDPFWQTGFNYEMITFDESAIPDEGTDACIPYLGQYGTDYTFGTAFSTSTGFIQGFAFPVVVENPDVVSFNPNVEVVGKTASIDCCQATDIAEMTYRTPNTEGRWLDTDGDTIADLNVEELLASKGLMTGDMNMTVRNLSRTCEMLPYLRGECDVPQGQQVLATTFTIPLAVVPPTPEQCDLNGDRKFGILDIRIFAIGCKNATATWECDLDRNGEFSLTDSIRFVLGCRLSPDTWANVNEATALMRHTIRQSR
ncbi:MULTISPECIES: hypothetical protein [unclassified Thiocapsa]|uniref:hypothetical protein n=1 Tax=unclassified Thiocapsa TaxID=2641286 RepID=UPI0035AE6C2E